MTTIEGEALLNSIKQIRKKRKEQIVKKIMLRIFMIGINDKVINFNYKSGEVFSTLNSFSSLAKGGK